ncbi:MAG: hypothetical protein ACFHU9_05845 [Fluviicola sp.]
MTKTKTKISQREFDSKYLEEQLGWIKHLDWTQESWKPKTALVDKKGNVTHLYTGQKFDAKYFDLVDKAWSHDHCDICSNRIEEGDTYAIAEGNIICDLCFEDFVKVQSHNSK